MIFLYITLFFVSIFVLIKSGAVSVKKIVNISRYLSISEYVLAFILMAIATSLPEFFIGITSALSKTPTLALGNVIGANLSNFTLVLGVVVLVAKGLPIRSKIAKRDAWTVFFISILPLLLLADKNLSRSDGIILLIVFFWYMRKVFRSKDSFEKRMDKLNINIESSKQFFKDLIIFILATGMLLLGAWGVIETATLIAKGINLPISLIGLLLVALGTSLPELVFGIKSVITKHQGINLGTLVGSIVINSTLVLGITALIYPIEIVHFQTILIGGIFMVVSIFIVNIFISTKKNISQKEGIILIGIYLIFLIAELLLR